ncbi:MAG: hypothetical protein J5961_04895 [Mogibacterium sp.]|nr:hypothetical protein [Mogibacterium sp.]
MEIDWWRYVDRRSLSYIMGNPPFVGYKLQTQTQKEDLSPLYGSISNIDYVAGWYYKASEFMKGSSIRAAFVSTNSICQGEQVQAVWEILKTKFGIHIDFAHPTFKWESEASSVAAVHCIIVGFSSCPREKKPVIITGSTTKEVDNINFYLIAADDIFISKRNKPICESELMIYGSEPREGGFLILSEEERIQLINETPDIAPYIKRFVSSEDYINNRMRFCLWLTECDASIMKKSKIVMHRLDECRKFREKSKQKQAHQSASTPYLFTSIRQPNTDYLLIPVVSSANICIRQTYPKSPFRTQKNRVLSIQFFVLKVDQTSLKQLKFQRSDKRKTSDFSEVSGG